MDVIMGARRGPNSIHIRGDLDPYYRRKTHCYINRDLGDTLQNRLQNGGSSTRLRKDEKKHRQEGKPTIDTVHET